MGVVMPCLYANAPVQAIMAPLSSAYSLGTTLNRALCSLAIMLSMVCSRLLAATPPVRRSSGFSVCASARSVTSVSMENAVSWRLKHTSSRIYFLLCNASMVAVSRPLNERSMPLIVNGSGMRFLPLLASFSIMAPSGLFGLCFSPASRAKTSRQLPIAMSRVSPNIL